MSSVATDGRLLLRRPIRKGYLPDKGPSSLMHDKPESVRAYHKTLWLQRKFGKKSWA